MKIKNIALLLTLILVTPPAFANESANASRDNAINLLRSMGMEKSFNDSIEAVIQQISNGDKRAYTDISSFMHKIMNYKELEPQFADIYARNYTKSELQDILDFYNSTTGKKSLQLMPKVMAESMAITQNLMKSHQAELEQLRKKGSERDLKKQ